MSVLGGVRRATRAKRAVVGLWAAGLFVSLPMGLLGGGLVHRFFAPRLAAERVAARLDPLSAADFFMSNEAALALIAPVTLGLLALWMALAPLLHGLAYASADSGSAGALARAGQHYFRLLALSVGIWGLFAVILGAYGVGASVIGRDGLEGWRSERGVLLARAGLILGGAVLYAWVRGAAEVMRARVVIAGDSVWASFRAGIGRGLRAPHRLVGWVAVLMGASASLTVLASLVDTRLPRDTVAALVAGVALQQTTALGRAFARVALAGAAVTDVGEPPERGVS